MFNKIKIFSLAACAALVLQACHSEDDALFPIPAADAPKLQTDVRAAGYATLRKNAAVNGLFQFAGTVAGTGTAVGSEPCPVKVHKMTYSTVGGKGEATTSTGVAMVPYGESAACSGPRPVVLYAHGTNTDRDYDLSDLTATPPNPAITEAAILLAFYASQGYVVVAPNYAGYDDSTLDYHPYLDEVQQSTEMIDALNHFKTHATSIGANISSKLFVTGLSQGGYVAMATHKALEAKGETVTASLPISGPYAMLDFLDTIIVGYVNGGATVFAPMYLTSAQKRENIYTDPSEVYSSTYVANAENSLPRPDGFPGAVQANVLPANALFNIASMPSSPTPPLNDLNKMGFGSSYLIADSFRNAYIADIVANGADPQHNIRKVVKNADLRTTWSPASSVYMCGSKDDPVVYHSNSDKMASHLAGLNNTVTANFELSNAASGVPTAIQSQWDTAVAAGNAWMQSVATATANGTTVPDQPAGSISPGDVHSQTGAYCSAIALGLFKNL